jgi:hypothetical protein
MTLHYGYHHPRYVRYSANKHHEMSYRKYLRAVRTPLTDSQVEMFNAVLGDYTIHSRKLPPRDNL